MGDGAGASGGVWSLDFVDKHGNAVDVPADWSIETLPSLDHQLPAVQLLSVEASLGLHKGSPYWVRGGEKYIIREGVSCRVTPGPGCDPVLIAMPRRGAQEWRESV